jgi:hypothetical protein
VEARQAGGIVLRHAGAEQTLKIGLLW